MATAYETVLGLALLALQLPTPAAPQVRRSHRTAMPREFGDAVHLVDGPDELVAGSKCGKRRATFMTSIFVRGDAGASAADAYRSPIYQRFRNVAWPTGVVVKPGRTVFETEIADADVNRIDIEWTAEYVTGDPWSLELREGT